MIIDAHVHLSIYQGNASSLENVLKKLLLEMGQNGVHCAIVIPDNIENDPKIADLNAALKLINGYKNLFLLGSPQVIQRGNREVDKYRVLLQNGTIKGLKFFPGHDPYYPNDERCLRYYEMSQHLGTPVIFHTGENSDNPEAATYNDPKYIVEIANRYPTLKAIITHYGWPKIEYCYEITKDVPNIYFELAGTADKEVLEKSGGIEKMKRILRQTITDRPDQVIFGTDWPMCGIADHIKLINSLALPKDIKERVFYKNTRNIYKLPI